jgi:hypothetical protein
MPIKFKISVSRVCLILLSIGDEELRDGQTLTSINQAFKFESINISNP